MSYGRAVVWTSLTSLYSADIINYDWTPKNNWFDHTAMISYFVQGGAQVCCHTPRLLNYSPWHLGDTTAGIKFIHVHEDYPG